MLFNVKWQYYSEGFQKYFISHTNWVREDWQVDFENFEIYCNWTLSNFCIFYLDILFGMPRFPQIQSKRHSRIKFSTSFIPNIFCGEFKFAVKQFQTFC